MKKAIFIIPYFGKLPYYFSLWMKTAAMSSKCEYLIITDDRDYKSKYLNIRILNMDFNEFVNKCQNKFDFEIGLKSPRKLCDFKPAYGFIFEEYIKDYYYWGYCDIDVILGDLDKLIPFEMDYDKLFVHGHMTLIRNNYKMNRLFMESVEGFQTYKDILKNNTNQIFDEASNTLNINLIAQKQRVRYYYDYNIADINPYYYLFNRSLYDYDSPQKRERTIRKEKINKQLFLWKNGSLIRYFINSKGKLINEEMRYFHFQKRILKISKDALECNSFIICPNKVIPYNGEINSNTINKFVKKRYIYPQYFRLKYINMKNKIGTK